MGREGCWIRRGVWWVARWWSEGGGNRSCLPLSPRVALSSSAATRHECVDMPPRPRGEGGGQPPGWGERSPPLRPSEGIVSTRGGRVAAAATPDRRPPRPQASQVDWRPRQGGGEGGRGRGEAVWGGERRHLTRQPTRLRPRCSLTPFSRPCTLPAAADTHAAPQSDSQQSTPTAGGGRWEWRAGREAHGGPAGGPIFVFVVAQPLQHTPAIHRQPRV